ncbi:MAG: S-adenosylmethionine:tRNA ribosyltransferase-isomerase, partial [Candidatus Hodarchaeota archaeon]
MNKLNKYNFILPEKYIAQNPLEQRDSSKLLILKGNKIQHKLFYEFIHEVNKDDVLILNDSKVIPARFNGMKETGGLVSLLFLKKIEPFKWHCLIEGKRIRPKIKIIVENGLFEIEIIKHIREGIFLT